MCVKIYNVMLKFEPLYRISDGKSRDSVHTHEWVALDATCTCNYTTSACCSPAWGQHYQECLLTLTSSVFVLPSGVSHCQEHGGEHKLIPEISHW